MSKLWSCVLVFTLAAFVAVTGVFAADAPKKKEGRKRPSPEQIFKKLDGNQDGKLTVDELAKSRRINGDEAKAKEVLGKMDTNKDGSVCLEEFTKAFEKRHAQRGKKDGPKKGPGKREKKE
jgi:Ca2+-binding EF-hand superfamily protein